MSAICYVFCVDWIKFSLKPLICYHSFWTLLFIFICKRDKNVKIKNGKINWANKFCILVTLRHQTPKALNIPKSRGKITKRSEEKMKNWHVGIRVLKFWIKMVQMFEPMRELLLYLWIYVCFNVLFKSIVHTMTLTKIPTLNDKSGKCDFLSHFTFITWTIIIKCIQIT